MDDMEPELTLGTGIQTLPAAHRQRGGKVRRHAAVLDRLVSLTGVSEFLSHGSS